MDTPRQSASGQSEEIHASRSVAAAADTAATTTAGWLLLLVP